MANNITLLGLAETISQTAKALAAQVESTGASLPTFAEDSPSNYPKVPEVMGLKLQLLDAVSDLWRLAMGPNDMAFINPLYFEVFSAVPLGSTATVAEIAQATKVPESLLRRLLNYAVSTRVFAYGPPGSDSVAHTSLSAIFVKEPRFKSWIRHSMEEARPGCVHIPDAIKKCSLGQPQASEELVACGFSYANIDKLEKLEDYWDYLKRDLPGQPKGHRTANFAESMQIVSENLPVKADGLLTIGYDWTKLGEATVVDIGGSSGHDASVLVKAYPNLKVIVQDLPEVQPSFEVRVPTELKDRISFQPHDFFTEQRQKGDVYLLKLILHDWPDSYAKKIIANILPHVKAGARIVLCEAVGVPPAVPLPMILRRTLASSDLQMMTMTNALERTVEQWKGLMGSVDEKLQVSYVSNIPGSVHNIIEITYQP